MKTGPKPSNWEVLAGMVERITYQNAENGFSVIRAKVRGHRELVTVVGYAAVISAGEWITATGEWLNDRTYGQVHGQVSQDLCAHFCRGNRKVSHRG
jgi:exodeoxyribonuclease V alpha subunit